MINIAVVQHTRSDKSSHFKAHRNLSVREHKAAPVSATKQSTMVCTFYEHHLIPNIKLWDIPGIIGNLDYTRENYLEKIDFGEYDFFLVVPENIFTDDDHWLAEQILCASKRFYWVRTKIDKTIEDSLEVTPGLCEEDVIADVRHEIQKGLNRGGLAGAKYKDYIVNNKKKFHFDFPALERDICCESYSVFKQEALLMAIGSFNREVIDEKYNMFCRRSTKAALASTAGGAVPVPGVSAAVDLTIIIEESLHYLKGFGLDKASIEQLEKLVVVEPKFIEEQLSAHLRVKYRVIHVTVPMVMNGAKDLISQNLGTWSAIWEGTETAVKFLVPVIGFGIAAVLSFSVTKYQLKGLFGQMRDTAIYVSNSFKNPEAKLNDTIFDDDNAF